MKSLLRNAGLIAIGLIVTACGAMNCSGRDPEYRCSRIGIVEYRAPLESKWQPLEGGRLIKCTPGQPVTAADVVKQTQ